MNIFSRALGSDFPAVYERETAGRLSEHPVVSESANPYQAPRADCMTEHSQRGGFLRLALGGCCSCIAAVCLAVVGLTARIDVQHPTYLRVIFGGFATAWASMGLGIFSRRDRLVVGGWLLFIAPLGALLTLRMLQIART